MHLLNVSAAVTVEFCDVNILGLVNVSAAFTVKSTSVGGEHLCSL